jgi:NhaA family Na+:H+ antiporter
MSLLPALGILLVLAYGGFRGVQSKLFYMLLGIVVWHFFLESGIHCTISGVLVALTVPAKPIIGVGKYIRSIRSNLEHFPDTQENNIILTGTQTSVLKKIESASDRVISPLQSLEDDLHSIVNYIIMPLFAFSNAGITLGNVGVEAFQGVTSSVAMGLLFGKVIGLFGFSWILIQTKIAHMPFGMNWKNLFGVSLLGGIGFTVSLFMANLSFGPIPEVGTILLNDAKLGVLTGSLLSGVLGYIYLSKVLPKIKNGNVVHE